MKVCIGLQPEFQPRREVNVTHDPSQKSLETLNQLLLKKNILKSLKRKKDIKIGAENPEGYL